MILTSRQNINDELRLILNRQADQILDDYKYLNQILTEQEKEKIIFQSCDLLIEDLKSFVERDPAAKGSYEYVLNSYNCFKAVISYRIANALYYYSGEFKNGEEVVLQQLGRLISEDAKIKTGIEIHPAAQIGSEFVIDHGVGTVIGETCVIGKKCYILQGVILGACGISQNREGKRHPTIGDEVEIGAFAKLFGAITIGSNVLISPGSIITQDIPSNSKVVVINEYQVIKAEENPKYEGIKLYGVTLEKQQFLQILGENFEEVSVTLVDEENRLINSLEVTVVERTKNRLLCSVYFHKKYIDNINKIKLKLEKESNHSTLLVNSIALKNLLLLNQLNFGGIH